MCEPEKSNCNKLTYQASKGDRIAAFFVFVIFVGIFVLFYMVKIGWIDPNASMGGCSFKSEYGIPCPACGMTTAVRAFMNGKIISAFIIQPAVTFLALLGALIGFFSLLTAVLGVNFSFLPPVRLWRGGYILLVLLVILASGWAVTLAVELAK